MTRGSGTVFFMYPFYTGPAYSDVDWNEKQSQNTPGYRHNISRTNGLNVSPSQSETPHFGFIFAQTAAGNAFESVGDCKV